MVRKEGTHKISVVSPPRVKATELVFYLLPFGRATVCTATYISAFRLTRTGVMAISLTTGRATFIVAVFELIDTMLVVRYHRIHTVIAHTCLPHSATC